MRQQEKPKKLIIIGGGFAGINVAKKLKKANLSVTLIDKKNHHLFQPLLYQVSTATLSPGDICQPFRQILRKQKNTTVIMGEVVDMQKDKQIVVLGNGDRLQYDYLVFAIGAKHSYFGNDHWEEWAPGIKTIKNALTIREHILTSFEKAERLNSLAETYKYLTFVIIGGGPTGVEFAGTIAELVRRTLKKNFRRISTDKARIFLIEGNDRLLPPFDPKLSHRTKQDLEKLGVTVLTKRVVTDITEDGVFVGERFIESKNVIWAAGNKVSPLAKCLKSPLDRQGRVIVEKDLSLPHYPEIFVLGDCAHCVPKKKTVPLPGVATVAIQQGAFLGKLLRKESKKPRIPKKRKASFSYIDKGYLATIGFRKAVGKIGKIRITGLTAWFAWVVLHIAYLVSFRNRIRVIFEWFLHYITGTRSVRIIHGSIDEDLPKTKKR